MPMRCQRPFLTLLRVLLATTTLLFAVHCLSTNTQCQTPEPETVRIDTELVNLHVTVLSRDVSQPAAALQPQEFAIFENGEPQEISFFAAAETPFDLVLLLDLSGSTADKMDLVRKSSKQFVDAARSGDRIAIISFADAVQVVSLLTSDHEALKKNISQMEKPVGGTRFWDALRFVLEHVLGPSRAENRRSAVIAMTDGVDNALPDIVGEGSNTSFEELIEIVRRSDAIVLPIYLDTEKEGVSRYRMPPSAYALARQQLDQLAAESGNVVYRARKIKDLEGVYARVIHGLSTVYSIGYRPTNHVRDGSWRAVTVQLVGHSDLALRSKRGYYAK
jgi:Ca-activated chloride channel homolog